MVAQALRSPSEAPSEPLPEELRAALERLLDDARAGAGGTLVVDEGYAAAAAELAPDFVVLHANAAESEAGLPYAVLADVLRPVLHLLPQIPEPQGEALRAAFALAAPSPGARFAVCAGTLNLLVAAGPVLVAIEHAQWIDEASAEPLRFAFRRLDGTRVAAVLGTRAGASPAGEPSTDPQRLVAEADAARAAGKPERALQLLETALAATNDPLVRADAHHLRGTISMWRAAPAQAARQLRTEAERIEPLDPEKAAWMSADAAWAAFMGGELEQGLATAEKASALAAGRGVVDVFCTGLLGVARMLGGKSREAKPLVERFAPLLDDAHFLERASTAVLPAALGLVWLEEHAKARAAFTTLVEFARTSGRPAMLPHALIGLSELEFRTGDWVAARAAAADAVRLAEETGQPVAHAFALLAVARVDAPQGREADCTAHVFESVRLAPSGAGAVLAFAGTRLGALELGLGRSEATISHLEQVAERTAEHDLLDPGVIQWPPDLIEALVRCGRVDDARRTLDVFDARARETGRVWALGASARCRGLLAPCHSFADAFLEARELHESSGDPFEQARTELCFGERLRRARRRVDSRPPLRAALAIFERLGATPWADRARTELRATGETVRSGEAARTDELTPQELEIARIVAQGATNREAAAALYVSVKTIEAHLGRIYRKLRVRSRTELARLFA
jgi:DNA-binding CsgD family transcriptional regulator